MVQVVKCIDCIKFSKIEGQENKIKETMCNNQTQVDNNPVFTNATVIVLLVGK